VHRADATSLWQQTGDVAKVAAGFQCIGQMQLQNCSTRPQILAVAADFQCIGQMQQLGNITPAKSLRVAADFQCIGQMQPDKLLEDETQYE